MKVIIDNSNLFAGGGIQVAVSFLNDIKEGGFSNSYEYHVIQSPNMLEQIDTSKFPANFIFYNLSHQTTKSISFRKEKLKEIESKVNPACIFTVFGPSYHKSKAPKVVGFAIPYIIYSDSPFFKTISIFQKLKFKMYAKLKSFAFIKNSDSLIFETDNARKVFVKRTNYKLPSYTVSNTLNEIFNKKNEWTEIHLKNRKKTNILFLTANYPHKNIQILDEVISVLTDKYKLTDFKFYLSVNKDEISLNAKSYDFIEFLGKVPLNQIPSLYQQTQLTFIPTLLEVFSATYLESMYMERPIIASDMPFSRDICSDAAIFCSPLNANQYAEAIINLIQDDLLVESLVNKGKSNLKRFGTSLDRTKEYLSIIEKTIKSHGKNIR